jgi:superfamily II DNA or RNA helicase
MYNKTRRIELLKAIEGLSSWTEIHSRWGSYTEKEKGDRFEDLTQCYLQVEPEYSSKLKNVWRIEEVPQAVAKALRLPSTDKGIDLVAETREGEYWAIQCKYRQNTDQQLTHTDISTFTSLTFQACKGFSFALVCSTTERVTSLYRDEERIGFCALDVWQELDREFFTKLRNKLTDKVTKLEPRKPRPHQIEAVKDGIEHFIKDKATRGKLIMPCGTGKSLTAWFLSQELKSKRIVIAVPSLSLVKQTLKVWLRESVANNIDVEWICVCSDETAGRSDQDDVVVQRQDIAVPCLTSTDKIADWLKTKHKGLTVVFTTYQSGNVLATAARKAKFVFDLGIMDEAHKTVGDEDKQFSILLHDHNVVISKRVFMTATERRYKGSSDKVLSMDNLEVYGDTFHQLSFKQAMEAEKPILCDYNIITIGVSRQEIKELIQKNVFVRPTTGKWDEELEADMLAAMVALRKAMKEHPIKHAVSFHGSIQRAQIFQKHNDIFTKEFPEFGSLEIFHVSGQTPTGTRSNIIKNFAQAERSLVTNARCLTEGVDVPGIDCVLFADPRKSTVDIVQAVGRALRPSDGKKLGYVILPILHDTDATSEQLIESGAFKEVLSTLSALAANDDRIIEYFRGISQGRNPSGSSRVSFEMDERIAERIDIDKLVHDLEIKCWNRLAKLSWRPFEEAREFVRGLKLKSSDDWKEYCQGMSNVQPIRPLDIPSNPNRSYVNSGWKDWGDWLGTGRIANYNKVYLNFEEARNFARSLGLKSGNEWIDYCTMGKPGLPSKPESIPASVEASYADKGWISWGDWLGTGRIANYKKVYLNFEEARNFAQSLGLKSGKEWNKYCKGEIPTLPAKPTNIPQSPIRSYKGKGWINMGDWLGTGRIADRFKRQIPFSHARKFARSLKLKSSIEWRSYCKGLYPDKKKLIDGIPVNADASYKNQGWISWGDWLGSGVIADHLKEYREFKAARAFVHTLGFKNQKAWRIYCSVGMPNLPAKPIDIPSNAASTYKDKGWISWGDWFGSGYIANSKKPLIPFNQARDFVRSLGLKNQGQWQDYRAGRLAHLPPLPVGIPASPSRSYKNKGWISMGDWIGSGNIASQKRIFKNFDDARIFARSLKLVSKTEWEKYTKGLIPTLPPLPKDIPVGPSGSYKDKGWISWSDWLGNGVKPKKRKKV